MTRRIKPVPVVDVKRSVTPDQDEPKSQRAFPGPVRVPADVHPIFGRGAQNPLRMADSHPVFGTAAPRGPMKRWDDSMDVRKELDA